MLGYGLWWNEHGNLNAEEEPHETGITLTLSPRLADCACRHCFYCRLRQETARTTTTATCACASTRASDRDAAGQPELHQQGRVVDAQLELHGCDAAQHRAGSGSRDRTGLDQGRAFGLHDVYDYGLRAGRLC